MLLLHNKISDLVRVIVKNGLDDAAAESLANVLAAFLVPGFASGVLPIETSNMATCRQGLSSVPQLDMQLAIGGGNSFTVHARVIREVLREVEVVLAANDKVKTARLVMADSDKATALMNAMDSTFFESLSDHFRKIEESLPSIQPVKAAMVQDPTHAEAQQEPKSTLAFRLSVKLLAEGKAYDSFVAYEGEVPHLTSFFPGVEDGTADGSVSFLARSASKTAERKFFESEFMCTM